MGIIAQFFGAALFGCFVSLILFGGAFFMDLDFLREGQWFHIFWIIPIVWGLLGIFWFDAMLDAARHLVDGALGLDS